jgi:hypothetical protein
MKMSIEFDLVNNDFLFLIFGETLTLKLTLGTSASTSISSECYAPLINGILHAVNSMARQRRCQYYSSVLLLRNHDSNLCNNHNNKINVMLKLVVPFCY